MGIPKIIHYCWLGGAEKPPNVLKCIKSWRKFCPDYEIIEWNETNLDISTNMYTKQAYDAKKWGFVPDYLRLWIIYNYGGIYLDTDVQVITSLDNLLTDTVFMGFEDDEVVALGLGFGAIKGNKIIYDHMQIYNELLFINEDGTLNCTASPEYTTEFLKRYGNFNSSKGIQTFGDLKLYPEEFFCPKNNVNGEINITKNTLTIHHFDGSWLTEEQLANREDRYRRYRRKKRKQKLGKLAKIARKILGDRNYEKLRKL